MDSQNFLRNFGESKINKIITALFETMFFYSNNSQLGLQWIFLSDNFKQKEKEQKEDAVYVISSKICIYILLNLI